MSKDTRTATNWLLVGAALLLVAAAVLLFLTRAGKDKQTKTAPVGSGGSPATSGKAPASPSLPTEANAPTVATDRPGAPGTSGGTPIERDPTGEPASGPPATKATLPPRTADEKSNTPTKQQTDDAFARILARIDDDIAKAKTAGNDAKVRRLAVRKARIELKRKIKMAEEPPKRADKPRERPATPSRPPEE